MILLNQEKIKEHLEDKSILIDLFESIDSTNSYLSELSNNQDRRVCIAEIQTSGKARFQKQWHSEFGQNIMLSLQYPFHQSMHQLSGLSLVVGLAVCQAIEQSYSLPETVMMKWPNDVMYDQKKLSGILVEINQKNNEHYQAVIGIGINVNAEKNTLIDQPWISIREINHQENDRNILCAALINSLLNYIEKFKTNGLSFFLSEWERRDIFLGKQIQVSSQKTIETGICQGVTAQGHLILKLNDGHLKEFSSGDASILKK